MEDGRDLQIEGQRQRLRDGQRETTHQAQRLRQTDGEKPSETVKKEGPVKQGERKKKQKRGRQNKGVRPRENADPKTQNEEWHLKGGLGRGGLDVRERGRDNDRLTDS